MLPMIAKKSAAVLTNLMDKVINRFGEECDWFSVNGAIFFIQRS